MPMLASGVAMIRSEQPRSAALPAKHRPDAMPMRGHHAGEPRPERERHDVEAGDHRVIGVARPAAAALGEQHDRQAAPLDDVEEAILLAMPHDALCPGEDRVVVGEHRAVRALLADQRAVDARSAGDEPVGRRAADQVVDTAPSALRRDRQAAVLDEGALVTQVVEILACGPASGRVPGGDDIAAALVANQVAAAKCFREVGTRVGCSGSGIR